MAVEIAIKSRPPTFSGKREDWPDFHRDFKNFLTRLAGGRQPTDTEKVQTLMDCLDEPHLKLLKLRMDQKQEKFCFQEEFARLEAEFSRDLGIGARKRWEAVNITNPGRIGEKEWWMFEADFLSAMVDVKDLSKGEAARF